MRTNHKLLDLFSGIGGFSLGAERNGIETIGFVEKDKFCQKVLKKHWSDVPIIDDIRKVNGKDFGSATIISGGFPCQPFSVAGKREGTDDDRYLWDEMLRVISSCKPTWVIGENVEGLINIQDGMVLRQVQDDLERQGFQVQCLVIPASGIGAWHQRNRVWIIGCNVSNSSTVRGQNSARNNTQNDTRKKTNENVKLGIKTSLSNNVSDTQHPRWVNESIRGHRELGEKSREKEKRTRNKSSLCTASRSSKRGTEDSNVSQTWWQTQSELCGVPNGVSYELHSDRTNRIKSLGNSIVPQIAEQIFRSIIDAE